MYSLQGQIRWWEALVHCRERCSHHFFLPSYTNRNVPSPEVHRWLFYYGLHWWRQWGGAQRRGEKLCLLLWEEPRDPEHLRDQRTGEELLAEREEAYEFLGMYINNRLGWRETDVAHRKGLRFFNAPPSSQSQLLFIYLLHTAMHFSLS